MSEAIGAHFDGFREEGKLVHDEKRPAFTGRFREFRFTKSIFL